MNNSQISDCIPAPVRLASSYFSIALLAALLLISGAAHAQYGPDDEAEALEAMKPKAEAEAKLPPMSKVQDLLPVDTGRKDKQNFAIDIKSLTVSPDHIIRYTVIATSSSGAQNISYEGIDCTKREFKRYAYGGQDGKWARTRSDKWEKISSMSQNQLHFILYTAYFCRGGIAVGSAEAVGERIRYNRTLESTD